MRFTVLLFSLILSAASLAQDIRYISGEQRVSLRGGAGDDYPVVYRGIAAGTRLTVEGTSEDGQWAEITAEDGVTGWIPTQKLTLEPPAPSAKPAAVAQTPSGNTAIAEPGTEGAGLLNDPDESAMVTDDCETQFNTVAQELHRLKQISGKAEQLDIDNRRLVEQQENLRSEVDMLNAENQRLLDKIESEDFMNGALAVLLGVIIALVAPRLVPQRRKNSGWA
ncbi:MAG: TIGR04211 family SH3 domain-containing protein [Halioglobus sp.]